MSFPNNPGVYPSIDDRSFVTSGAGVLAGAIVITSKKGPLEVTTVTSSRQFIDLYGLPSRDNPSMYSALRFLNRAGILTVKRVVNDAEASSGSTTDNMFEFTAANPGAWGNELEVRFAPVIGVSDNSIFQVIVYVDDVEVEHFQVSRDPDAKNGFGANIFIENVINRNSMYVRVEDDPLIVTTINLSDVVEFTGGLDDTVMPSSGDIVSAWEDFENPEEVLGNILINAGFAVPEIQNAMINTAMKRGDAVAILDVPQDTSNDVDQMVAYRTTELNQNTHLAGLYGGWLRVYDQYNDLQVTIPPSGDVAAVFVNTVEVAERWDAPAGLQRGIIPNALGVTKIFSDGERDILYSNGINPVTSIGGASAVVWGQKTLQVQASALDRFNVVNSVLWINQRVSQALRPFVHQPNNVATRDAVNFLISAFLENVQQRGGLYAFNVDTSEEINTPFVIDNNQMYVDVYIQPVRAAEFIRVRTIITPTGVQLG